MSKSKLNVVITAGGTSEYIDKVRKITNSSSGLLGAITADQLAEHDEIEHIFYICSQKAITPEDENNKISIIRIVNTNDLKNAVTDVLTKHHIDWFIHSMAVSDYYVDAVTTAEMLAKDITTHGDPEHFIKNPLTRLDNSDKLSSYNDNMVLILKQTPKVISIIKELSPDTKLIGFKLLDDVTDEELLSVAKKLMDKNKCDYVIANDLKKISQHSHTAFLLNANNQYTTLHTKIGIANAIENVITDGEISYEAELT